MTLQLEDDISRLCEVASRPLGELNIWFDASRTVFGLTSFYLAITQLIGGFLDTLLQGILYCQVSRKQATDS